MNLLAHAQMLASSNAIKVVKVRSGSFIADPMHRLIRVTAMHDETDYYSVLHEIAHIVLGHGHSTKGSQRYLLDEYDAWAWALDHGKAPQTPRLKELIAVCLKTYVRTMRRELLPAARHPFWNLANGNTYRAPTTPTRSRLP